MTSFYVDTNGNDSNSGAFDKPFKTIQKAAQIANSGDEVFVRKGTYSGTVSVKNSGVKFTSVTKHGAVLNGMFEIKGKSNVHIYDFKLQGSNYGVRVEGPSNGVVISGNYLFNTNSSGISVWGVPWQSQPSALNWKGVQNISVVDNILDHCCNGGYNEIMSFANGVDGVICTDNRIINPGSTANGGEGPDFKCGVKNVKYLRNVHIGLNKVATYVDGGIPENGLYNDPWNGVNENIEIAYNEYIDCGAAINVSSEAAGSCKNIHIHDNYIKGGTGHGVLLYLHPKRKEWAPNSWQYSKMENFLVERNVVINKPIGFIVNCAIGRNMVLKNNLPFNTKTAYQLLAGGYTSDNKVATTEPSKPVVTPTPVPTDESEPIENPIVTLIDNLFLEDIRKGRINPKKVHLYYTDETDSKWFFKEIT